MNLRTLQYLVTLAEEGHFGRAADRCNVSQPTLSMQLKKLEDDLGTPLLERGSRTFLLTEQGTAVLEKARDILHLADDLRELCTSVKDPFCSTLRLGLFPTVAPFLLPMLLPAIKATYPKLTLHLAEEKSALLIEQLLQGKLDAAVLALPVEAQGLVAKEVFREEFLLAVAKSHPLSDQRVVKASALRDQPMLLLDDGHCLREQSLEVCSQIGARESAQFRATSMHTLLQLVGAGMGVTLVPELAEAEPIASVSYLRIVEPTPYRVIGLCWRASSIKTAVISSMVDHISSVVAARISSPTA